ncbi:hypothetical protein ACA910_002356 [Epithemia clementina (nom. ined.)]
MSESNQATDPPKQVDSDDDKDFGDFDLAPEKPKIDESWVTAGATKSDKNNDKDNDFEGFGSAAPTMASAAPAMSEQSETHPQQPQHAQPRSTATIHIESNLVLKLIRMSFEKMFGHYSTMDNFRQS